MDGTAVLINVEYETNSIGDHIKVENRREVFVTKKSISRTEWAAAGQRGMNPQMELEMSAIDYEGEEIAEYEGVRYAIYRTYQPEDSDRIELYLQKETGVTNGH